MNGFALLLVICAAFVHALWNYLAKRAGGGAAFVWLFGLVSAVVYTPLAVWLIATRTEPLGWTHIAFMAGSAALHAAYFLLLQRGYRTGDLSLVYPLARGTGPLLATLAAIAFFAERPTLLALAGAALVVGGIFFLAGGANGIRAVGNRHAVGYGLLTGVFIASYTLWDKQAVAVALVPPLVLDWGSNLGRTLLVSPYALHHRARVREVWRTHWRAVLAVGVLCPLSYILVLTAMVTAPVSYVAPARELSIVIGALLGAHLLAEPDARRRIAGAIAIVAGVIALAAG